MNCDNTVESMPTMPFRYLLIALWLIVSPLHAAKPVIDSHDPEMERQSFQMLKGFEANLWAAEPMLSNPVHMTWDPQGRLWVCCSPTYPHVKPGQTPNDKIIVLEDTDGDGKADKSTVFADGLYVPTGLELGDGGVYVANAPDLLFFKDTDGDLKADVREVVLTGFATEDNHHSISAWRWGPGGWLYFQEGTFMHSQVETPHGVVRLENGGVFQLRPRELKLQVNADYRASNPWGHMFDRWGSGILIDNPNLYFIAPLTANSRAKLSYQSSGRGTKQAGGEFVSGRHLPKEYHGQIWTNQYKANTVARYEVSQDRSGVSVRRLEPLIRSTSTNFRPVDLKVGPDGAVYFLDWYNPLIGHMQHSFRDERRDTNHGRVWRITHKGSPLVKKPQLTGVPLTQTVSHLKDSEDWTRHQVKRVLAAAAPKRAAAALAQFVGSLDRQETGAEHHRLEALWSYQTIGVVNERLLRSVLASPEPRARTAALRVLRYWHDQIDSPLELLVTAVKDPDPRVRLEAVLTLGYVPDPQSAVIATRVLSLPMDRYLGHALTLTVDGLQQHWLPKYRAGELTFDEPAHREFALANLLSDESIGLAIEMFNSGSVDPARLVGPAETIALKATAKQLEPLVLTLFEHTRSYRTRGSLGADVEAIAMILQALDKAARTRRITPKGGDRMVQRCLDVPDVATRQAAMSLAGVWNVTKMGPNLATAVQNPIEPMSLRIVAANSLGELGTTKEKRLLLRIATGHRSPADRYLGVIGLVPLDAKEAARHAAILLAIDPAGADPVPLVEAFTNRKGGGDLLAVAIAITPSHQIVSSAVLEHFIRTGAQHAGLRSAFGGDVAVGTLEDRLLKEDPRTLASEALKTGDPTRGEGIFRRQSLACMTCHPIGGAGPNIGPDLAAIGSSSLPDYLIDSMLRPSKVIKEFYETVNIFTDDGRVMTGILVSTDQRQVIIRDPKQNGKEIVIPANQIDELVKGESLMPVGLANRLADRQEFLDLARFIMELGKPGPYAASTRQIVRRWHLSAGAGGETATYATVGGVLPWIDLKAIGIVVSAIAHVDVTTGGAVEIKLNSTAGVTLSIDDDKLAGQELQAIKLATGRHSIQCEVDLKVRTKTGLRVELLDVPNSPARYKVVGGL